MYGLGRSINTVWVFPALAAMFVAGAVGPAQTPGAEIEWPSYGNDRVGSATLPRGRSRRRRSSDWNSHGHTALDPAKDRPDDRSRHPCSSTVLCMSRVRWGEWRLWIPTVARRSGTFDPQVDAQPNYPDRTNRGVAVWRDPSRPVNEPCARRVFFTPVDSRLIALDRQQRQTVRRVRVRR